MEIRKTVLLFFIFCVPLCFADEHDFNYNYASQGYSVTLDNLVLSIKDSVVKKDEIFKANPIFRISHNKKHILIARIKIQNIITLLKILDELKVDPGKVDSLGVSICGLNDLTGLDEFKNISYLGIYSNNLSSFPNLFNFPYLTEIIYDGNNFSQKEESRIKNYLANIDWSKVQPYKFKTNKEYEDFINTSYKEAEFFFDLRNYQEAIIKYQEVVNAFEYCNNEIIYVSSNADFNSKIKEYEKLYFSLYNISCSYSLLENFDKAKEFLYFAIKAGYPYLKYILKDEDLKYYFEKDTDATKDLKEVYSVGNNNSIIEGKTLKYVGGPASSSSYYFSNESNSVLRKQYSDSDNKNYFYGNYFVKNYFVICNFYKNIFLDNKGFVVGIGIKEEDCEKMEKEVNFTVIIPISLIENVKTYHDWPYLEYEYRK